MDLITRKQLKEGHGLSDYLATSITKGLDVVKKKGRTNLYLLTDVVYSIECKLGSKRIKTTTREALSKVLKELNIPEGTSVVTEVPDFLEAEPGETLTIDWEKRVAGMILEDKWYNQAQKDWFEKMMDEGNKLFDEARGGNTDTGPNYLRNMLSILERDWPSEAEARYSAHEKIEWLNNRVEQLETEYALEVCL